MIAKAIYEMLHVEYRRAPFFQRAFSSLCQWSSIFFKILHPVTFADKTNLFYEDETIKHFATVNKELRNINHWFMANKLSLKVEKTKYSLFHKPSRVDDLTNKLTKLSINNQEIKRASLQKFLGFFGWKSFMAGKFKIYWQKTCKKHWTNVQS